MATSAVPGSGPRPPASPIRPLDRLLRRSTCALSRVFFRRVELEGEERLKGAGPAVYLANHGNSLVDPMLLLAHLPAGVRFLAKSTLWEHPVVRHLVRLAGAIPVFRRQDEGVDPDRNRETFARCHQELAGGGAIALFPEGISHAGPRLEPLRTGAARIVLGAEERHGPLGLRVVPVGLIFEDRSRFRSRVLIRVGEAVPPPRPPSTDRATVEAFTETLEDALRRVTLNFDSWEEARLVGRAADLYQRPEAELPGRGSLASRTAVHQAFAAGYRHLRQLHPERLRSLARAVRRYDLLLEALRLRDDQVASRYPSPGVLRFVVRSLWWLLLKLPLAAVGTLLNWLPYRLPGWITAALRRPVEDRATYKVISGLILFPLFWGVEVYFAARIAGWPGGLATAVVAPSTGLVALLFADRWSRFREEARAFLLLRTSRRVREELRERRREILGGVQELVRLHERNRPRDSYGSQPGPIS